MFYKRLLLAISLLGLPAVATDFNTAYCLENQPSTYMECIREQKEGKASVITLGVLATKLENSSVNLDACYKVLASQGYQGVHFCMQEKLVEDYNELNEH